MPNKFKYFKLIKYTLDVFSLRDPKGLCKENKIPKIRVYYGSGWVGPGPTRIFLWKIIPK